MAGTIFFALSPLYLTQLNDAIYDGALLVVAVGLLADALFRCVDPENRKPNGKGDNLRLFFTIASVCLLTVSLLQYGPIANDLRREKSAQAASLEAGDLEPLRKFEDTRNEDRKNLPNSSMALLICSVLAEFSVISVMESQ